MRSGSVIRNNSRHIVRNTLVIPILLLAATMLLAACGGGGGGSPPAPGASLSGTVQVVTSAPQLASNIAHAVPLEAATEGRLDATRAATDAMDVYRVVATASRTLTAIVDSAHEVDVCLHSLDTGACGRTLELAEGEVCDVVVTARSGSGAYSLRLEWGGARGGAPGAVAAELPSAYWERGDDHRADELVAAPAVGQSGATIARAAGLECLAESPTLCKFRAPSESGDATRRYCRLLARCARLRASGLVRFAEPNYVRRLAAVPNDPLFFDQWSLEQIRIQGLWNEGIGSDDFVVAIVDSGVEEDHPAMAGRLVDGYDFALGDSDPHDATSDRAHGTMVGSIAAGATNDGNGIAAVAWGARIMPLRVFNAVGGSDIFDIVQAIRYAAGLSNVSGELPSRAALVVNLSFAGAVFTQSEEAACIAARAAGTLPVGASGNGGTSSTRYPAAYASVLAVGGTTREGERGSYSSYGPWMSLMAPGGSESSEGVIVADRLQNGDFVYREAVGTSFAAPHVSGVAALLMHLGTLTPDEVQSLLESTARDIGPQGFDDETGFGILDADAAGRALFDRSPPVLIPGETIVVRLIRASDGVVLYRAETSDSRALAWSLADLPAGRYRIDAGTDRDFDGRIDDPGELYGVWQDGVGNDVLELAAGEERGGITIALLVR